MKVILLCCFVSFALWSCSCGESPEPTKPSGTQTKLPIDDSLSLQSQPLKTIELYDFSDDLTIYDIKIKTDYTSWFTWKNYDGKKENAEQAVYIWNGEEVGRGAAGFGEILKRIESMPKPVKHKLGLSVFCPQTQTSYDDSPFWGQVFINMPFKETNKEYNKIVKRYSHVDEIKLYSGSRCLPMTPNNYNFSQNCPFDRSRLETVLEKKKIEAVYVIYSKSAALLRGEKPASDTSQKAEKE